MYYYQHNIEQFDAETSHLTRNERAIYRDLIDIYHYRERPFRVDEISEIALKARVRSDDDRLDLSTVLAHCFKLDGDVYRHERIDETIRKYQGKGEVSRVNGGKSQGRPKKNPTETPQVKKDGIGNPEQTENNPTGLLLGNGSVDDGLENSDFGNPEKPVTKELRNSLPTTTPWWWLDSDPLVKYFGEVNSKLPTRGLSPDEDIEASEVAVRLFIRDCRTAAAHREDPDAEIMAMLRMIADDLEPVIRSGVPPVGQKCWAVKYRRFLANQVKFQWNPATPQKTGRESRADSDMRRVEDALRGGQ